MLNITLYEMLTHTAITLCAKY